MTLPLLLLLNQNVPLLGVRGASPRQPPPPHRPLHHIQLTTCDNKWQKKYFESPQPAKSVQSDGSESWRAWLRSGSPSFMLEPSHKRCQKCVCSGHQCRPAGTAIQTPAQQSGTQSK